MPSATMMQPSLADCTTMPWISASSGMTDFSAANMVEPPEGAPPVRQAFSLTTNVSVSARCPVLIALKMTSDVISLASDAGGISLSASLENSTVPVSASIMKACCALVSNTSSCAVAAPAGSTIASASRMARKTDRKLDMIGAAL